MNSEELEETIREEITTKTKKFLKDIETIKKDLQMLSSNALELNIYFDLAKRIPLHELAKDIGIKPSDFNKLKRSCKLTKNSPQVNRSLLSRFGIVP